MLVGRTWWIACLSEQGSVILAILAEDVEGPNLKAGGFVAGPFLAGCMVCAV